MSKPKIKAPKGVNTHNAILSTLGILLLAIIVSILVYYINFTK